MWTIKKEFGFCYGHRVYTQTLREELALTSHCKCRHLHGHEGLVGVALSGVLNPQGMVLDFTELSFLKKIIDTHLDHKMILDEQDPILDLIVPPQSRAPVSTVVSRVAPGMTVKQFSPAGALLSQYEDGSAEQEAVASLYGGIVLVPFVPTSENIAAWLYQVVAATLSDALPASEWERMGVEEVVFHETPKTSATYRP